MVAYDDNEVTKIENVQTNVLWNILTLAVNPRKFAIRIDIVSLLIEVTISKLKLTTIRL